MSELDFASVKSATQFLGGLRRRVNAKGSAVATAANAAVSLKDQVNSNVRHKRQDACFNADVVMAALVHDICNPTNSTLPVNFSGVINMADQAVQAAEILQSTQALFEKQLHQFNEASDKAVKEAKQRVSQLNDYTNRLGTSLTNLNKVLGDERMARALENADKIAAALKLLDSLQQGGNLDKIIAALQAK